MPAGAYGNLSALLLLAGTCLALSAPCLDVRPDALRPEPPGRALARADDGVVRPAIGLALSAPRLDALRPEPPGRALSADGAADEHGSASPGSLHAHHPAAGRDARVRSSTKDRGDEATGQAVATLVLRVDGLDADVLRAALARRRPDLQLLAPGQRPTDGERTAYVEVVAVLPRVTLDVVHADGRAWRRTLDTGGAPGERAAARLLVQLLAAIAERRAEPERTDVPAPDWTRDPRVAAPDPPLPDSTASAPSTPPATVPPAPSTPPVTVPPASAPSGPVTAPIALADPAPPPDVRPTPAPAVDLSPRTAPPPAAYELGVAGDFAVVLGLTPPRDVSALRGLGGGVRLDLRFPRAVVLGLGLRGLARAHDGVRLARLRGAVSVGWLARRGRFEALLAAGLSLETWRVRQQGAPVYYAEPGADTRPLLLGGLVRAAPGVRLTAGPRLGFRVGAWLELAGSVLPTGAAARLSRTLHDGAAPTPLFALGGVELAAGLELAAWFTLRRR